MRQKLLRISFNKSQHSSVISTAELCNDWLKDEEIYVTKSHRIVRNRNRKNADVLGYNSDFIKALAPLFISTMKHTTELCNDWLNDEQIYVAQS